jgi:DNA-binding transcriptional MerR regulator
VARLWRERLDDPDEPLFTIAVVAELLATDHQTIRRIESAIDFVGTRPSGNQRRYSRNDVARLDQACALKQEGLSPRSIGIALASNSFKVIS